jgi:peptidoglycan/LPS O-acetylase OafA/YrhL
MRFISRAAELSGFGGRSASALESGSTGIRRSFLLKDIDRRDTAILKGLAIAFIVFHNFFHAFSPFGQNEFSFVPSRFSKFLAAAAHPALTIQALFSFFGHFGVELFIFLSAYGLTKSHWNDTESWSAFMWGRIRKLYPTFGLVVIPWVIASCILVGPDTFFRQSGLETLLMLLGLSTILGFLLPPVGPWWFIPFIVQFYAIWPGMRKFAARFGWKGLLVLALLCRIITAATFPMLAHWKLDLLLTPIGHMTELCLGIAAARYELRITAPFALLCCAILFLGSDYWDLWLFTYTAALLVSLWLYSLIRAHLRKIEFLKRLGEYSLLIFLVNAIVRNQFLSYATSPASQLLWGCISACVSLLIAMLIQDVLLPAPVPARQMQPTDRTADVVLLSELTPGQLLP